MKELITVRTLEEWKRQAILKTLIHFKYNIVHTADTLDMAPKTLRSYLAKYKAQGFDVSRRDKRFKRRDNFHIVDE